MDFAIEYIVMYVSTLFLNNFTLNILFVNSLYLNGRYVIAMKISADDNQGHEDSKWLFVMYFRCTSFFYISNPKEYVFVENDTYERTSTSVTMYNSCKYPKQSRGHQEETHCLPHKFRSLPIPRPVINRIDKCAGVV